VLLHAAAAAARTLPVQQYNFRHRWVHRDPDWHVILNIGILKHAIQQRHAIVVTEGTHLLLLPPLLLLLPLRRVTALVDAPKMHMHAFLTAVSEGPDLPAAA
jgi:hypothetical protein